MDVKHQLGASFCWETLWYFPSISLICHSNQAFLVALGLNGWKGCGLHNLNTNWLVVSTHLKNIRPIGWFPQIGMKKSLKPPPSKPITVERAQRNPHISKLPSFPRATSPFPPMPTQPSRKVQNKFFRGVDWKTHCHVLLQVFVVR